MRSSIPAVVIALALALGCASVGPAEGYDPFAGLDGKADGARDFFRGEWTLELDTRRDRLRVTGDEGDARYDDVERSEHAASAERIRLDRGDRLAGMRSFLIALDPDALARAARIYGAVGLEAPRVVAVRWVVDGRDLGRRALVEHVGDRFLSDRFGADDGLLVRGGTEDEVSGLARALSVGADPRDPSGPRALSSTFDLDTVARALAAEDALGGIELALYDPSGDGTAFSAIPELGAAAIDPSALRGALRHPDARAAYARALHRASDCLESARCGGDPTRGAALAALAALHDDHDAPDGYAAYATWDGEGSRFRASFRHLEPGTFALAVRVRAGGREIPLVHDRASDLWSAELSVDGPFDYDFVVLGHDGVERVVADPSGQRRFEPASFDVLEELWRVPLEVAEPSGLTMFDSRLFVVGDEGDDVFEIDPETGASLLRIDVGLRGLEGLAIDPWTEEILVADEDRGRITRFTFDGDERSHVTLGWANDDADGGIEGLTLDLATGHVLLAKERSPMRIAELDVDGEQLARRTVDFASDLSALAVNPSDGRIYALSDQDHALLRLDADWDLEASWDLDVDKPEGLVVEGDRVYVVSDARHELVVYRLGR